MAADKLMRVLRANGHEAELDMTDEVITRDAAEVEQSAAAKPEGLCFVEFDENYLEFIRADLIRLGLMSSEDLVSTGDELDGEEWLCPKCGKVFEAAGSCPRHQIPLVTFEDYAGGAKAKADTMPPWLVAILVAVFAAAAYYKFFR